jgi:D-threo-aldose 1-dehydrogenase
MGTIELGRSGRKTTRLGFGCSSLMGAMGRKASLAMLEAAYDAGVRHFDVAPMYGFGEAESCVGEFLRGHRDQVTVTTKYGIPPGRKSALMGAARSVAGPVVKLFPGLKRRLIGVASKATEPAEKATFTAAQAKASLERSLGELKTERIDVWLLHEVSSDDLRDDELLRMLEDSVAEGVVGMYGVGSERAKVEQIAASHPAYCPIVQCEWSVMDAPVIDMPGFRIHHRSLTDHFRALHERIGEDQPLRARWSREVGVDLADRETLASLMLKAALVENPDSVILVSSKNPNHIRRNVEVAGDKSLEISARRFYEVVQREVAISTKVPGQVTG